MDPHHPGMRPAVGYQPGMPVSNGPIFYQPNPAPNLQPYTGQPVILAGGFQPQQHMPTYNAPVGYYSNTAPPSMYHQTQRPPPQQTVQYMNQNYPQQQRQQHYPAPPSQTPPYQARPVQTPPPDSHNPAPNMYAWSAPITPPSPPGNYGYQPESHSPLKIPSVPLPPRLKLLGELHSPTDYQLPPHFSTADSFRQAASQHGIVIESPPKSEVALTSSSTCMLSTSSQPQNRSSPASNVISNDLNEYSNVFNQNFLIGKPTPPSVALKEFQDKTNNNIDNKTAVKYSQNIENPVNGVDGYEVEDPCVGIESTDTSKAYNAGEEYFEDCMDIIEENEFVFAEVDTKTFYVDNEYSSTEDSEVDSNDIDDFDEVDGDACESEYQGVVVDEAMTDGIGMTKGKSQGSFDVEVHLKKMPECANISSTQTDEEKIMRMYETHIEESKKAQLSDKSVENIASSIVKQAVALGVLKFMNSMNIDNGNEAQNKDKMLLTADNQETTLEKESRINSIGGLERKCLYSWSSDSDITQEQVENKKPIEKEIENLKSDEWKIVEDTQKDIRNSDNSMIIKPSVKKEEDFEKFYFKQKASQYGITIESPPKAVSSKDALNDTEEDDQDEECVVDPYEHLFKDNEYQNSSHSTRGRNNIARLGKNYSQSEDSDSDASVSRLRRFSNTNKVSQSKLFKRSVSEKIDSDIRSLESSQGDAVEAFKIKASNRGIKIQDSKDVEVSTESEAELEMINALRRSRSNSLDLLRRETSTPDPNIPNLNPKSPEYKPGWRKRMNSGDQSTMTLNGPQLSTNPDLWNLSYTGSDTSDKLDNSMRADAPEFRPSGSSKSTSMRPSAQTFKPKVKEEWKLTEPNSNPVIVHLSSPKVKKSNPSIAIQASPVLTDSSSSTRRVKTKDFSMVTGSCGNREVAVNTYESVTDEDSEFYVKPPDVMLTSKSTNTDKIQKRTVGVNVCVKIPTVSKSDIGVMTDATLEDKDHEGQKVMDSKGQENTSKPQAPGSPSEMAFLLEKVKSLQVDLMWYKEKDVLARLQDQMEATRQQMSSVVNMLGGGDEGRMVETLIQNKLKTLQESSHKIQDITRVTISQITSGWVLNDLPDLASMCNLPTTNPPSASSTPNDSPLDKPGHIKPLTVLNQGSLNHQYTNPKPTLDTTSEYNNKELKLDDWVINDTPQKVVTPVEHNINMNCSNVTNNSTPLNNNIAEVNNQFIDQMTPKADSETFSRPIAVTDNKTLQVEKSNIIPSQYYNVINSKTVVVKDNKQSKINEIDYTVIKPQSTEPGDNIDIIDNVTKDHVTSDPTPEKIDAEMEVKHSTLVQDIGMEPLRTPKSSSICSPTKSKGLMDLEDSESDVDDSYTDAVDTLNNSQTSISDSVDIAKDNRGSDTASALDKDNKNMETDTCDMFKMISEKMMKEYASYGTATDYCAIKVEDKSILLNESDLQTNVERNKCEAGRKLSPIDLIDSDEELETDIVDMKPDMDILEISDDEKPTIDTGKRNRKSKIENRECSPIVIKDDKIVKLENGENSPILIHDDCRIQLDNDNSEDKPIVINDDSILEANPNTDHVYQDYDSNMQSALNSSIKLERPTTPTYENKLLQDLNIDSKEIFFSPPKKPKSFLTDTSNDGLDTQNPESNEQYIQDNVSNSLSGPPVDKAAVMEVPPTKPVPMDPCMMALNPMVPPMVPPMPMMMAGVDPILLQAVVAQLIQAYPEMAGNPAMLSSVAFQQTKLLQYYMSKGQAGPPNSLCPGVGGVGPEVTGSSSAGNIEGSDLNMVGARGGDGIPETSQEGKGAADSGITFQPGGQSFVGNVGMMGLDPISQPDKSYSCSNGINGSSTTTTTTFSFSASKNITTSASTLTSRSIGAHHTLTPSSGDNTSGSLTNVGVPKTKAAARPTRPPGLFQLEADFDVDVPKKGSADLDDFSLPSTRKFIESAGINSVTDKSVPDYSNNKSTDIPPKCVNVYGSQLVKPPVSLTQQAPGFNRMSFKTPVTSWNSATGNSQPNLAHVNDNKGVGLNEFSQNFIHQQNPPSKSNFMPGFHTNSLKNNQEGGNTQVRPAMRPNQNLPSLLNLQFQVNKNSYANQNYPKPQRPDFQPNFEKGQAATNKPVDFLPEFAKRHRPEMVSNRITHSFTKHIDDQVVRSLANSDTVNFTRKTPSPPADATGEVFVFNLNGDTSHGKAPSHARAVPHCAPTRGVPHSAPQNVTLEPKVSWAKLAQKKAVPPATSEDWDNDVDDYAPSFSLGSGVPRSTIPQEQREMTCVPGAVYKPTLSKQKNTEADLTNPLFQSKQIAVRNKTVLGDINAKPSTGSIGLCDIPLPKHAKKLEVVPGDSKDKAEDTEKEPEEEWCQVQTKRKRHGSKEQQPQKVTGKVQQKYVSTPEHMAQKQTKSSNFERLVGRMQEEFPQADRSYIISAISKIREMRGSLSGLSMEMIIEKAQAFLHVQKKQQPIPGLYTSQSRPAVNPNLANLPPRMKPTVPPPSVHSQKHQYIETVACPDEDICVICHDPLSSETTKMLDCRHVFHSQCIGQWVERERTCPTCRKHALFPEEFPKLGK